MSNFLIMAGSVAIVLGIMVLVHEWGHFVVAKAFGVRVEIFSIGFGTRLWGYKHGDTDYRLSALPLGGYVKLHGQERPQDVAEDVRAKWIPGQTFHDKTVLSRASVVAIFGSGFGLQSSCDDHQRHRIWNDQYRHDQIARRQM